MPTLLIHHVAIICSSLEASKKFYVDALGFKIIRENYRQDQDSWKVDLDIDGRAQIELFWFKNPPPRVTSPEACGLHHLTFRVYWLEPLLEYLEKDHGIKAGPVRNDDYTGRRFTTVFDPDGLPIELYED